MGFRRILSLATNTERNWWITWRVSPILACCCLSLDGFFLFKIGGRAALTRPLRRMLLLSDWSFSFPLFGYTWKMDTPHGTKRYVRTGSR